MEDSDFRMHPLFRDPTRAYAVGDFLKVLRPQIEDLDKASAAIRPASPGTSSSKP